MVGIILVMERAVAEKHASSGAGMALCPTSAPCCSEYGYCGSDAVRPPSFFVKVIVLISVSNFVWEDVTPYGPTHQALA
jgi:hypothetical protein